jgi:virulence-associated protein VapD
MAPAGCERSLLGPLSHHWRHATAGAQGQLACARKKMMRKTIAKGNFKMYAITFDMDTIQLEKLYHAVSYNNAYADIGKILATFGFERQQGSVYFGNERVDAVTCVIAVQKLTQEYSWFGPSVRDIRMLRIEDLNDLRPAINQALAMSRGNKP